MIAPWALHTLIVLLYLCSDISANEFELEIPTKLDICDNVIVADIDGGKDAVLAAALIYIESMRNNSIRPIEAFKGAWKWEIYRLDPPKVPECKHLKVFGNERKNYDEAKRFCYVPTGKLNETCSNDKWDFEVNMHHESNCVIETFDCTCNATVPVEIRDRTRFHQVCLAAASSINKEWKYSTFAEVNDRLERRNGPDYLKIDVEGFEWSILKAMIRQSAGTEKGHMNLPLQIYAEFHLDVDANERNEKIYHHANNAHVGRKLRHFLDEMFVKAGYMLMHTRTTMNTRNTDMLLVKVLCPEYSRKISPKS